MCFHDESISAKHVTVSFPQCRLSAGARVKAALWIPPGGRGGPLQSAGLDPSSGKLPGDLVSDWCLERAQVELAVKDGF